MSLTSSYRPSLLSSSHHSDDDFSSIQGGLSVPLPRRPFSPTDPMPFTQAMEEQYETEEREEFNKEKKRRWCMYTVVFLFGSVITLCLTVIVWKFAQSSPSPSPHGWSPQQYIDNFKFYQSTPIHALNVSDNNRLDRLDRPILSPDGSTVIFLRTLTHQYDLNQTATHIWYVRLPFVDGFQAQPLTRPVWGVHDSQIYFGPESRSVLFLSNRDPHDTNRAGQLTQIFQTQVPLADSMSSYSLVEPVSYIGSLFSACKRWIQWGLGRAPSASPSPSSPRSIRSIRVADPSSDTDPLPTSFDAVYYEALPVSSFPLSVDNLMLDPFAQTVAFSIRVFPSLSIQDTYDRLQRIKHDGSDYHVYDQLYVRHWNEWLDGTRSHIFLQPIQQDENSFFSFVPDTDPIDIMFGLDSDSPTRPSGEPSTEWAFSRSGYNFAFTRQHDEWSNVSWNTNLDIYTVSLTLPPTNYPPLPPTPNTTWAVHLPPICRTCSNLATDTNPVYSPNDENTFVYRSTNVPGYESDRYRLRLYRSPTAPIVNMTESFDRSIVGMQWNAAGTALYMTVTEQARQKLYLLDATYLNVSLLIGNGTIDNIAVNFNDSYFLYTQTSHLEPTNIYIYYYNVTAMGCNYSSPIGCLTTGFNNNLLNSVTLSQPEEVYFSGYNQEPVQSWVFKPVNFSPLRKYPLAFLIHGGPQSPWASAWSYRWNPQIYANAGYVVVMINFHGTSGWGQAFTDSITNNYGTVPFVDLLNGLEYFLTQHPVYSTVIDSKRMAALGASWGGYAINWLAGKNSNLTHPFQVFVCHDGIFDQQMMYYSTEELFFVEHDLVGVPWLNPTHYQQFNPINYVSAWNTPQMIIHGGLDYRIDLSQGLAPFTLLQRRGIPSKFLYFPKEAHQVMNAKNQVVWHTEVLNFIQQYVGS